jgi:hypothetical protein
MGHYIIALDLKQFRSWILRPLPVWISFPVPVWLRIPLSVPLSLDWNTEEPKDS